MNIDETLAELGHILDEESAERAEAGMPMRRARRAWTVALATAAAIAVTASSVALLQHDDNHHGTVTTTASTPPTRVTTPPTSVAPKRAATTSTLPAAPPNTHAIRDIDFKNFTYDVGLAHVGNPPLRTITVHDGTYSRGTPGNLGGASVTIRSVVFGDFDGDGNDEAAVQMQTYGDSMLAFADYVFVFKMHGSKAAFAAAQTWGARADGGISAISAHDGALYVDTNSDGPACCPEATEYRRYVLQNDALVGGIIGKHWNVDGKIIWAESPPTEAEVLWIEADSRFPTPVSYFDATAGSRYWIHFVRLTNVAGVQLVGPGGTLAEFAAGAAQEVTLPATGRYEFRAVGPAYGKAQPPTFSLWINTPDSSSFSVK
jgi:hypothetical protein